MTPVTAPFFRILLGVRSNALSLRHKSPHIQQDFAADLCDEGASRSVPE